MTSRSPEPRSSTGRAAARQAGRRRARADAEALRRRLLSRAETGAVADWLERRHQLGRDVFARGRPDGGIGALLVAGQEDRAVQPRAGDGDVAELFRACLVALRVPEGARPERTPRLPLWTLAEGSALAVFLPKIAADAPDRALRCKAALASTLLVGLELARSGTVTLEQDQPWQPVRVSLRTQNSEQNDFQ